MRGSRARAAAPMQRTANVESQLSQTFRAEGRRWLAAALGLALGLAALGVGLERASGNLALTLAAVAVAAVAGGVGFAAWIDRRLAAASRALERLETVATPAPAGAPAALDPSAPFASLAEAVERAGVRFARVVAGARELCARARELSRRLEEPLRSLESHHVGQESAAEEIRTLFAQLDASIHSIHEGLENLSSATEEASSSVLEMGSSINEIARNAAALEESVDSSTATIHQITGSIHQVAASSDAVQEMAEETAAAMTQMDRAIREVSEHVREASQLTERVSQDAEDGSRAVASTIEGIETIRTLTLEARHVLGRLAERIGAIGDIVTVIGSVNEETNLLSLNAAIIAAQAGEQGKAFAVVANHVKTLAERTSASTQEIDKLIRAVQEESSNAVQAMGSGIEAVESGVERSRRAGKALEAIRLSAHDASSRVAEIARAATEQTRNSKHVAEAARRTSEMVQEITRALAEQRRASEQMLRNAEQALETTRQVHRSTQEQRESSRFVTTSIASISEMIHSIQQSAQAHARANRSLAESVRCFLDLGQQATGRMPEVWPAVRELARESEVLEAAIESGSAQAPARDRR